ncbi:MAG: ATP-binding protein [Pseudomonadota bacterium]
MSVFWWGSAEPGPLRIIFWFRSFLIVCQIAAVILAKTLFSFSLDIKGILIVIGCLLVFNIFTFYRSNSSSETSSSEIFIQLLIDVIALSALFFYSGGASNPFVSMYLLPLAIGAVLLSSRWVWLLAAMSIFAYSYLMWGMPGEDAHAGMHHGMQSFDLHVLGMWISFVLSAGLIAYFVVKMRTSLKEKELQLQEAREQSIKDEKLVSLGALAASTAHELGTPLGTMQLIISDLRENNISQGEIDTLLEQVQRCKQALNEMSITASELHADGKNLIGFKEFMQQLLKSWQHERANVTLTTEFNGSCKSGVAAEKTLSKALVNLLDNAADASPDSVNVRARWEAQEAEIVITDRGSGIDPENLSKIGTRPYSSKPDGIGLGAFLAHEIIQRLGGSVKLANHVHGGLETTIILPLRAISS